MKTLIVYVIWNKHDMMNWLCSGILKSFPNKEVDIYFLLDNPIDGTELLFEDQGVVPYLLKNYNWKYTIHYGHPLEQFKFHLQNIGMKYGYDEGYDWIICPQDDQKIEDPFLLENLESVNSGHLGLIGGRDGFNQLDYVNGHGSLFSHPVGTGYTYLKNGEYMVCNYLNDGPLVYHRKVIEKVGYHDERYKVFFSELDYCQRCSKAGLVNINLGMSIVHEKFGTLRSNVYHQKHAYSEHDNKLFTQKWS